MALADEAARGDSAQRVERSAQREHCEPRERLQGVAAAHRGTIFRTQFVNAYASAFLQHSANNMRVGCLCGYKRTERVGLQSQTVHSHCSPLLSSSCAWIGLLSNSVEPPPLTNSPLMSLLRSDSCSTASSHVDGGLEDLCLLFAEGHVEPIVAGLLAMRATLTRDAPDTVHTCFSDALPEMLAASATPFELVLQLLDEPALAQRGAAAGGKVDLRTLLVRALRSVCISERMHSLELWQQQEALKRDGGSGGFSGPASAADSSGTVEPDQDSAPAELTPALTARARDLCLRGTYLNPRTYEAVVSLYRVVLTQRELLSYARACFAQGSYRDAAEFLKAFRLETEEPCASDILRGVAQVEDGFPHARLLARLVCCKQDMDVLLAYLGQSPTFLSRHAHAALTNLAEQGGGNDPNLAAKLALRFGMPLSSLPRVLQLKLRDILWWVSRIGKAQDFGELIAGDDPALQRKLVRELTKSKAPQDRVLACSFLDKWPHQLKDKEYADFYEQQKKMRQEQLKNQS